MKTFREMIVEKLSFEIEHCGISQRKLAEKIGVHPSMITDYKSGKKFPSLETFALLCKIIGADANYILGIKDI